MLTNAELAILGLLVERPRHGYEIEQVIEERGMREWTEVAFSSIYYILRKLEKRDLLRSVTTRGEGKGPARKVYTLTGEGQKAWYEATIEALSTPARGSDPFLLGLAGLPAIPLERTIDTLQSYSDELKKRRDHIQNRWRSSGQDLPLFLEGMFDLSCAMLDARKRWVDGFIDKLSEGEVGSGESEPARFV